MTGVLQEYWNKLGTLHRSIGLILFKAERYHTINDVVLRSEAQLADFREVARAMVPPRSRFVNFAANTLFQALQVAHDASLGRKLIIQNFNLGLSRLAKAERDRFWATLIDHFPANSNVCVALALPGEQTAVNLLPAPETLQQWIDLKRAIRIN